MALHRVLALAVAVVASCCLAGLVGLAVAAPESALVLHTSLVDLLNTENARWSVALGSLDPATPPEVWTAMQEVRVEALPAESAASLLFTLPPPASSYVGMPVPHDDDEVEGDDVYARAQRRALFGHASLAFHGISCEEYRTNKRGSTAASSASQQQQEEQGSLHGRCFLLRDKGSDLFVEYTVRKPAAEASSTASASRRRRNATGGSAPVTASANAYAETTTTSQSAAVMWTERITLSGTNAATAGGEESVHVGTVSADEYIRTVSDARDSTHFVLTLFVSVESAAGHPNVVRVRLECLKGAFYDEIVMLSAGAAQAARTSFFNRWVWPLLFLAALYALVYGAARVSASRKAAVPSSGPAAPSAVKKQQ